MILKIKGVRHKLPLTLKAIKSISDYLELDGRIWGENSLMSFLDSAEKKDFKGIFELKLLIFAIVNSEREDLGLKPLNFRVIRKLKYSAQEFLFFLGSSFLKYDSVLKKKTQKLLKKTKIMMTLTHSALIETL